MSGTQNLWLFIVSGLLLNITPGPDSLFIMARSATQGWRAGFAAVEMPRVRAAVALAEEVGRADVPADRRDVRGHRAPLSARPARA